MSKSSVRTKKVTKPEKAKAGKKATARRPAKTAKTAGSRVRAKLPKPAQRTAARSAPEVKPKARTSGQTREDFAVDKLMQVELRAANLEEAVKFYRDILGLRFITRFDSQGFAFFDMGGFRLMLSANASGATLYFRVIDIDQAVKSLRKRGVAFLQAPAMMHRDETGEFGKKGTEEWMAFFKDPSGNVLALTERR